MASLEIIDDICDNLRQLPTSFDNNRYQRQESIDNYDPNAINSVVDKYKNAPIPLENKWNTPLFLTINNNDHSVHSAATYPVPNEKYRN